MNNPRKQSWRYIVLHPMYHQLATQYEVSLFQLIEHCKSNKIQIETVGWIVELGTCQLDNRLMYYVKRYPKNGNLESQPILTYFSSGIEWIKFIQNSHYKEIVIDSIHQFQLSMKGDGDEESA